MHATMGDSIVEQCVRQFVTKHPVTRLDYTDLQKLPKITAHAQLEGKLELLDPQFVFFLNMAQMAQMIFLQSLYGEYGRFIAVA